MRSLASYKHYTYVQLSMFCLFNKTCFARNVSTLSGNTDLTN